MNTLQLHQLNSDSECYEFPCLPIVEIDNSLFRFYTEKLYYYNHFVQSDTAQCGTIIAAFRIAHSLKGSWSSKLRLIYFYSS